MVFVKIVGEKETLKSIHVCKYKAKQNGLENGKNSHSQWLLWPNGYSAFGILRLTHMAPKFLQRYTVQKQRLIKQFCVIISMTSFHHFRFKSMSAF